MGIKLRMYWFLRNLSAFVLIILLSPVDIALAFVGIVKTLFVTDGSVILLWPWENWSDDD